MGNETIIKFVEFYKSYDATLEFIEWLKVTYNWYEKYSKNYEKVRILNTGFIATIITKLIQGHTIKQLINEDLKKNTLRYVIPDKFKITTQYSFEAELFDKTNGSHMDSVIVNTLFQVQNLIEFDVKKYIQDFHYRVNKINNNNFFDRTLTNFLDFTTIDNNKIKLIQAGVIDTFAINKIIKKQVFKNELNNEEIDLNKLLDITVENFGTDDPLYFAIEDIIQKN